MKAYIHSIRSAGVKLPAALVVVSVFFSVMPVMPASAQLPPVNWGKSVHGPGDNQYSPAGDQQGMRHPANTTPTRPSLMMSGPAGGGGGGGGPAPYRATPKRPKPDISLQPIPADEPVTPPGFPPLPDRLDLPGVDTTTAMSFSAPAGGGSSAGGGPSGGGGAGPGPVPFQGKKQGYAHFAPGAFSGNGGGGGGGGGAPMGGGGGGAMPPMGGGGAGGAQPMDMHQHYGHAAPGAFAEKKASVGYYKCGETAKPQKPVAFEESFGSDAASKPPAYTGASNADLKKLGREPKLDDRQNGGDSQPEAPTPVQINQAATQDLSLPDDEFRARRPPSKTGRVLGKMGQRVMNRAGSMMNQGMNMGGMGGLGR